VFGWFKKSLRRLFKPVDKGAKRFVVPEQQPPEPPAPVFPAPLFVVRQPILRQHDWQELIQTGEAGNIAENMALEAGSHAALHWGRMLLTGQGTQQDRQAALAWFQQVAQQGESQAAASALNMLGRAYEHGWGVRIDLSQAFQHYTQAAERSDVWAMFNLADCYRKGVGCAPDLARAAELYARAASKGHVKSLNMLGLCYEEGSGVEPDVARAAELFAKGAELGDCWASFNHARLLAQQGEEAQSLAWLEHSLEQNSGDYAQTFVQIFGNTTQPKLRDLVEKATVKAGGKL